MLTKHGHTTQFSASRTYKSWDSMIQRCTNPNAPKYDCYGGREIEVCSRWRIFTNFLMDMGERPEGRTLDRKDVNKNYTEANCRWATKHEQENNKRNSHYLTVRGITWTISKWAQWLSTTPQTLASRIRLGWSDEDVVNIPIKRRRTQ